MFIDSLTLHISSQTLIQNNRRSRFPTGFTSLGSLKSISPNVNSIEATQWSLSDPKNKEQILLYRATVTFVRLKSASMNWYGTLPRESRATAKKHPFDCLITLSIFNEMNQRYLRHELGQWYRS